MQTPESHAFTSLDELDAWLRRHHREASELWVRIYKKGSGVPSVAWEDCVVAALTWGWIDSQKRALDEAAFLQRLTPRRARSMWSQKNREIAEALIRDGRMQPAGLSHVEAARADGRWEQAYAGSATMVLPEDFLGAVRADPAASQFYDTLDRRNLYAIYHRLHTARRPETRLKRIGDIVRQLAEGRRFH